MILFSCVSAFKHEAGLVRGLRWFIIMMITIHRLELANEALLGQSERLQERVKRMEEEGQISSRIIQVFCQFSRLLMMVMVIVRMMVLEWETINVVGGELRSFALCLLQCLAMHYVYFVPYYFRRVVEARTYLKKS